jgi:hypothetical protein
MSRTDRNLLLTLCIFAAPLFSTACTRHDAAAPSSEASSIQAPTIRPSKMEEVVITASRIDTYAREEEGRAVPN